MRSYGCIQARVDGVELTIDPTFQRQVPDGSLLPSLQNTDEVMVSGDERPEPRVNPLLRHKALGLGALFQAEPGEKRIA